jgi:hypothetical protein
MKRKTLDSFGKMRKGRDPGGEAEEARLSPRGKQVSEAQWNDIILALTSFKNNKVYENSLYKRHIN